MSDSETTLGTSTKFVSDYDGFLEKYGYTAMRFYLQAIARDLLPDERIAICWRYLLPNFPVVEIIYSEERKRARSRGTMKCGSVWVCPVCASYITERRRVELRTAIDQAREQLFAVLVTYTVKHNHQDKLADLLADMLLAFRKMKGGEMWQTIKEEWYMVGSVRAVEITYGDSGWHPHFHELLFSDLATLKEVSNGDIAFYAWSLQNQLRSRWQESLRKYKRDCSLDIGVTVRCTDQDVVEYVSKYGKMPRENGKKSMGDEVARGSAKRARGTNLSVYDILFAARDGDKRFENLFLEYVHATKGKSQLQWSPGLKARLNIDEIRDEIAAEGVQTETDVLLATIAADEWKWFVSWGYLGQLMTIANTGDAERLANYLNLLRKKIPTPEHFDFSAF
jgi:hypothetical protein